MQWTCGGDTQEDGRFLGLFRGRLGGVRRRSTIEMFGVCVMIGYEASAWRDDERRLSCVSARDSVVFGEEQRAWHAHGGVRGGEREDKM